MSDDMFKGLDEETIAKIKELQKVTREKDGGLAYAEAQTWLSNILYDHNMIKESIQVLKRIETSDSTELYNQAVYNIGITLEEKGEYHNAIKSFKLVRSDVDFELYLMSLLNIGIAYYKANNLTEAVKYLSDETFHKIPSIHAKAKYNLGVIYYINGQIKNAHNVFNKINRSDNPRLYAEAQYHIGLAYYDENKIEKAKIHWEKVSHKDNPSVYSQAVVSLGVLNYQEGYKNRAIEVWNTVKYDDNPEYFAIAWYKIGENYLFEGRYSEAEKAFLKSSESNYSYKTSIYLKVSKLNNSSLIQGFIEIFDLILSIVDSLTVENNKLNSIKGPERKLAHYTGTATANLLINTDDKGLSSPFRLNTIINVNDPSEGVVLNRFLNNDEDYAYSAPDFNEQFHAFVGCFTFNHDSLNQFRLYGKENNKEASGVSLVFGKSFFQEQTFNWLSNKESDLNRTDSLNGKVNDSKTQKDRVEKLPAMRCIYINPINDYLHLAQRNKLTFFNEFEDKSEAESQWTQYQKMIQDKTKNVKNSLDALKITYSGLKNVIDKIDDSKIKLEAINLIDEVLLPLQYLVKHYAFQEEQECRLIYITSLDRPEVKMLFGKFLYVDYEPDVKNNLDKVYIAPEAKRYLPYIATLLCDRKDIKVEMSKNPYRQI